jgi:hypothetical protein
MVNIKAYGSRHKNGLLCLVSALIFAFVYCYIAKQYSLGEADEYIGEHSEAGIVDVLDFHFIATNFAFTNRFPVTGFIVDENAYKIKHDKNLDTVYLNMFREYGPVTTFVRAPLYPLMVGSLYKIFGFKYSYNFWLNLFFVACIIAMVPLVGYMQWGGAGYLSGMAASFVFLGFVRELPLVTMDINLFSMFLVFLVFAVGVLAEKTQKAFHFFVVGVCIGLVLLTKPVIMPVIVVYGIYIFLKYRKVSMVSVFKKYGALLAAIFLTVLPYTVYINNVKGASIKEREVWSAKVTASMQRPELDYIDKTSAPEMDKVSRAAKCISVSEIKENEDSVLAAKVFTYIVKWTSVWYARSTKLIFVTNAAGDMFLNMHNEYCSDGALHFEWMFDKNSFYRKYCTDAQPLEQKIALFYYRHPLFIFRVFASRVIHSLIPTAFGFFYWLAVVLWAMGVIKRRLLEAEKIKAWYVVALLVLVLLLVVFRWQLWAGGVVLCLGILAAALLLYKFSYQKELPLTFALLWGSLFLFLVIVLPNPSYEYFLLPASCLYIVYYLPAFLKGVKILKPAP